MTRAKPALAVLVVCLTTSQAYPQVSDPVNLKAAQATQGGIGCFVHSEGWNAENTRPCSDYRPPSHVAIGEEFYANGKERRINVISGVQATEDVHDYGFDLNKGEWTCFAGETEKDISTPNEPSLWLAIKKCSPMR